MSDATQWLERAREGDPQAFRHVVEAHARPLFGVCVRITRDATLAEDAVQEAFYQAWRHLKDFDGRAAFSTWLHRIGVNAALEQLRRNARHVHDVWPPPAEAPDDDDFLAVHADDAPGPEAHAEGEDIARRAAAGMNGLSALERAAFVLRHVEGASLDTIAATLSLNIGQSKQAIFRAVRKLRGALDGLR